MFFQKLRLFPKRNNYIFPFFGKARFEERKVLSLESAGLSQESIVRLQKQTKEKGEKKV